MKILSKRRMRGLAALSVLTAVLLFVFRGERVEWVTKPPGVRGSRLAFLGGWMEPLRGQWLRVKFALIGAPKFVVVNGGLLQLDSPSALSRLSGVVSRFTNEHGAQIWLIKDGKAFSESLNILTGGGVMPVRGFGIQEKFPAQLAFVNSVAIGLGTNVQLQPVGCWLDLAATHGSKHSLELTCFITLSERVVHRATPLDQEGAEESFIQTNAAFGGRARVPKDGGLFLVSGRTNLNGRTSAFLFIPTLQ